MQRVAKAKAPAVETITAAKTGRKASQGPEQNSLQYKNRRNRLWLQGSDILDWSWLAQLEGLHDSEPAVNSLPGYVLLTFGA